MNTQSLITQAVTAGDSDAVGALLLQAPDLINGYTQDGWTPLHMAARLGHCAVVEVLLAHGADVNARAHNGLANTPLLWAVMGRQTEMVTLLLARGADVNAANTAGSTPLHKAAIEGNDSLVRLLLSHGARVNARNTGGQTPLVHARFNGHPEIAALLEQQPAVAESEPARPLSRRA